MTRLMCRGCGGAIRDGAGFEIRYTRTIGLLDGRAHACDGWGEVRKGVCNDAQEVFVTCVRRLERSRRVRPRLDVPAPERSLGGSDAMDNEGRDDAKLSAIWRSWHVFDGCGIGAHQLIVNRWRRGCVLSGEDDKHGAHERDGAPCKRVAHK